MTDPKDRSQTVPERYRLGPFPDTCRPNGEPKDASVFRSSASSPSHRSRDTSATPSLSHAAPSGVSRPLSEVIDSRHSPGLRSFGYFLGSEAPSLHGHYPASTVLRASPTSDAAQSFPRRNLVDRPNNDPRTGSPVLRYRSPCAVPSSSPRRNRTNPVVSARATWPSPFGRRVGFHNSHFRGPLDVHFALRPGHSLNG